MIKLPPGLPAWLAPKAPQATALAPGATTPAIGQLQLALSQQPTSQGLRQALRPMPPLRDGVGQAQRTAGAPDRCEPNMQLIAQLLEMLDTTADNDTARRLLIDHYSLIGWYPAALDHVSLLTAGTDEDVAQLRTTLQENIAATTKAAVPVAPAAPIAAPAADLQTTFAPLLTATALADEYSALKKLGLSLQRHSAFLKAEYGEGLSRPLQQWLDDFLRPGAPRPAASAPPRLTMSQLFSRLRSLDDTLFAEKVDLACSYLEPTAQANLQGEKLRQAAQQLCKAAPSLQNIFARAVMHLEHEVCGRIYRSNGEDVLETMTTDAVADIPRPNFFVTEDGYPWDMDELVQAIVAANGLYVNPMTKAAFTTRDVENILAHAAAAPLRQMHAAQAQLSPGGLSQATAAALHLVATTCLQDDSEQFAPSFHALDIFLNTTVTLCAQEQNLLKMRLFSLQDSHFPYGRSRQSIMQIVADGRSNTICIHKTGDFLQQIANQLSSN
jgi:hypothetical protein